MRHNGTEIKKRKTLVTDTLLRAVLAPEKTIEKQSSGRSHPSLAMPQGASTVLLASSFIVSLCSGEIRKEKARQAVSSERHEPSVYCTTLEIEAND